MGLAALPRVRAKNALGGRTFNHIRFQNIVGTFRETRTEINYRKWANVFPAAKSEPRHGGAGTLGLTTFTGGVRGDVFGP